MKVAQADNEIMIVEKQLAQKAFNDKLLTLFAEIDLTSDGIITREEFTQLRTRPELKTFMSGLGIDPADLGSLFDLIDDGDGCLTKDEFIEGATRIRGGARSLAVGQILAYARRGESKLQKIEASLLDEGYIQRLPNPCPNKSASKTDPLEDASL